MKKQLSFFLLVAAMCVPLAMQAQCPAGSSLCQITYTAADGYGDGWNDASCSVYQDTVLRGAITVTEQTATGSISICTGDSIVLVWNSGDYDDYECSFSVFNGDGLNIVTVTDGSVYDDGDTVVVASPVCPTCVQPVNLTDSAVTSDGFTVSWTPAGNETEWIVLLDGEYVSSVTSPTYTFTNLDGSTVYVVSVAAYCSVGDTSNYSDIMVRTDCADGGCNITVVMRDSYGDGWNDNAVNVYSGAALLGTATLTSGSYGEQQVFACAGDTLTFSFVLGNYPGEVSLDILNGDATYMVTNWAGSYLSSTGDFIGMGVLSCPPCPNTPSDLTVDSVDTESIQIHWTSYDNETAYHIFLNGAFFAEVNDTAYTITGLHPSVYYNVSVASVCPGSSDDLSAAVSVGVRTACGSIVAPYLEDFSSQTTGTAPACWTVLSSTVSYYGETAPSVTANYGIMFSPSYMEPNVIALPHIDLPVNEMEVVVNTFGYPGGYYYVPTMELGYVTSLDSNAVFYVLDTFEIVSTNSAAPDEHEFTTVDIPSTLDTVYLALRGTTSTTSSYGFVSNIEVRHMSNCGRPSVVSVDTVLHDAATISWDAVATADGYVVRYATVNNVDAATAVDVTVSDTTATITGLTTSTTYYTWVRSDCSSDSSDWRVGPSFTTTCGEDACMLAIDMFDGYGDGWNGNAISVIVNGISTSVTISYGSIGSYSRYICDGDSLVLLWNTGNFADETSFSLVFGGSTIYNSVGGGSFATGDTLLTSVGCPSCIAPTNLVAEDIDSVGFSVSWTAGGDFDNEWAVYLDGVFVTTVNTESYTFSGLTPNTVYTVGVATVCSDDTTNVAPLAVTTECSGGSCALTVDMYDSYGDGWNNNALNVIVDGVTNYVTLASGSTGTTTLSVCNGSTVAVTYVAGSFADEVTFSISFADGRYVANEAAAVDYASGDTVFVGVAQCRSCATPTGLTQTGGTSSTVSVAWNAGEATSWHVALADAAGATVASATVTTSSYTFAGLTAATNYVASVMAYCSATDSSWDATINVATPCAGVSLPWHDDFTTYTSYYPDCWSTPATSVLYSYTYPLLVESGRYSVLATSMNDVTSGVSIAATPMLMTPANNMYVRLTGYSATSGTVDSAFFEAGIMTNIYDPSTFVPVIEMGNTDGEAQEFEFLTNTLTYSDTLWAAVRVKVFNDSATQGMAAFVLNDIYVDAIPACQRPDSVGVTFTTSMTDVSATLTWDAVSGSTGYTVEVVGDTTYTVATNSITLTALTGNTDMVVRVYNNCSATSLSLPRSLSFTTPCVGITLPVAEGFESYSGPEPGCWSRPVLYPDYYGDMTPYVYNSTYYAHSGSKALYFGATSTINTKVISPVIYGPANNVNVGFWVYGSSSIGFEAGIMTDPNVDSTFIPMVTASTTSYSWTYYEFSTDSLTLTDTMFHFVFRAIGSGTGANYLYLDDITIATIPDCSEDFASIDVVSVGSDSVVVSFAAGLGRNAGADYTVSVMNAAGSVVSSVTVAASPVTIHGLSSSSVYNVYVSLNCGGSVTAVSDTLTFTTRCSGSSLIDISDSSSYAGGAYPLYPYYNHSVSQAIYPDSLLGDAAMLASLSVNCSTSNNTLNGFRGRIWLKEVPDTMTSVSQWMPLDSMTLVYDGALPLHDGWNEFQFNSWFSYSGNGNLMVCMMADTTTGNYVSGYYFYRSDAGVDATTRYYYYDSYGWDTWMTNGTTGYTATYRADMRFSVCGGGCQQPVIDSVVSDESSLTVYFTSDADSTDLTIGTTFTENGAVRVAGSAYTFSGLTHSTTYTIALRAVCGEDDMSEWTVDTASTVMVDCQTPVDVTVQATTYTTATISWTTTGDETAWGIRAYNTLDTFAFVASTNPYTITGLTSGATYNVEVRALCGQNSDIEGDWSDAVQVTTDVCQPVTGAMVDDVTSSGAIASWNAASGAIGYRISYGLYDFLESEATRADVDANTTSYTFSGLSAETQYEFYVQARCTDGLLSSVTAEDRIPFTTAAGGVEGIYDVENGTLTLYPNPASTSVTLTVTGFDGETTVEVVDLNGRTIAKYAVRDSKMDIDVSSLAQGAYFVRVTGESRTAVRKLIVR